ncbi:hypothetical protein [Acinetobacter oleivorans]|uniref:hypothetical protein n=1 Tax=Acinetobacter oleivorans TaxID=1148157 RepID=UPI000DD0B492|nr:hypothetical protein [Acinetobacter oleivorans]
METMYLVYHVRDKIRKDPNYIKKVQALTLNELRPMHGLKGTYGLYGSFEWLNNLESGTIPRKEISGIIQRIYTTDMDNGNIPDTMDIELKDIGKIMKQGIFLNNESDINLFMVGKRVEVIYYIEDMKAIDHSTGENRKHEFVLEMKISN